MAGKPQFDHKNSRFCAVSERLRLAYRAADGRNGAPRPRRSASRLPAAVDLAYGGFDLINRNDIAAGGSDAAAIADAGRMGLRP